MYKIIREAIPALTLDEAVLDATKPFENGCAFRCVFKADGSVWIEYGCYGGPWSMSGEAREWFHAQLGGRYGSMPVKVHPITKNALKAPDRTCSHCHHPVFEPLTPAAQPDNKPEAEGRG